MLKRLIVDGAYAISTSKRYAKIKHFFYNFLENDSNKYKKIFDLFMIALIFSSVAILIREVKSHVDDSLLFFNNYIISIIFLIEYLLRFWVTSSVSEIIIKHSEYDVMLKREFSLLKAFREIIAIKMRYVFSIKAIIDLFAILPFFHELRLLRLFVLFRVFKLFRYAKSIQTFGSVIATKKFEFLTLFIFASIVIFVSSVLIYVMEANNPTSPVNTLFEAIYWAVVTISTVGYGDIAPVTEEGRIVAMFVIVAGIAVFSFTTSLIVTAFTEKLDEIKDDKLINDIAKMKSFYLICGYEGISKEVAKKLSHNSDIIVLEENDKKARQAKKDGFFALNYDPGSIDSYRKLRINIQDQVKAILCLGHSDVENVYTALTVRSFNKDVYILSILKNKMNKNKLMFAGVNEVFYEKELVGMIAKGLAGQKIAFEAIHALRSSYNGVDMQEIVINERIAGNYRSVGKLQSKKFRILLLGLHKSDSKEFLFNPKDDTTVEAGDYLLLIGNIQFIKEFNSFLYKKDGR
ncbi:ion transporter [Sulfurimonas sp.]|uniref:ion transporter n=1 Tax=Sulfurimonas sp. TaxID=2022749 RepID=UPI0025DA46DA|nr:ion transporter [Sulfurimonas sp.]